MWRYQHVLEVEASRDSLWQLYCDVSQWPLWDSAIESVTLDGPFATGTTGQITPVGDDPMAFRILHVRAPVTFADETEIPGAIIRFQYTLDDLGDGRTRITHRMIIDGPDADFLGPQIGPMLTEGIPATMAALGELAVKRKT